MPRPRKYDPDTAVTAAMDLFWDKGYAGTKLPDLLAATRMSRGSFYKAFGNKKAMFLKALALYDTRYIRPAIADLETQDGDGPDRVQALFISVLDTLLAKDRRGCFLCNTLASAAVRDKDIAAAADAMINGMTRAFETALSSGPGGNSVTGGPTAQAIKLTFTYIGMRVYARRAGNALSPADLKALHFI